MTKKFDLYEHHQAVMKKLMIKDFREYVGEQGSAEMTEKSGNFEVMIKVTTGKQPDVLERL